MPTAWERKRANRQITRTPLALRRNVLHQAAQDGSDCRTVPRSGNVPPMLDRALGLDTICRRSPSQFVRLGPLMFLLRRLPLAMKQSRAWLREYRVGSHCVRLLVLLSFIASSIGIPVGNWSLLGKTDDSAAPPWCRCSKSAKQSGKCCCAKSAAGATSGACCSAHTLSTSTTANASTTSPPTAMTKPGGSCSPKKPAKTEVASKPTATPRDKAPAWTSACGCGPTDSPMLLVSTEPRILAKPFSLNVLDVCRDARLAHDVSPCGQRSRPLAPPPKSPRVG
jgi:hypothetical protein